MQLSGGGRPSLPLGYKKSPRDPLLIENWGRGNAEPVIKFQADEKARKKGKSESIFSLERTFCPRVNPLAPLVTFLCIGSSASRMLQFLLYCAKVSACRLGRLTACWAELGTPLPSPFLPHTLIER